MHSLALPSRDFSPSRDFNPSTTWPLPPTRDPGPLGLPPCPVQGGPYGTDGCCQTGYCSECLCLGRPSGFAALCWQQSLVWGAGLCRRGKVASVTQRCGSELIFAVMSKENIPSHNGKVSTRWTQTALGVQSTQPAGRN